MDRNGDDAAWETGTLTAAEIEFLGEDELITVTPCFRMKAIKLMSVSSAVVANLASVRCLADGTGLARTYHVMQGTYGPFVPSVPTEVPLWLAIQLKKAKQCKITPPEWLDPGNTWICTTHAKALRKHRAPCER